VRVTHKFLNNITDSDYVEDVRALKRAGATLSESIRSIRRRQWKIHLNRNKNKQEQHSLIARNVNHIPHLKSDLSFDPNMDFSTYKDNRGIIFILKEEWLKIPSKTKTEIIRYNKSVKRKHSSTKITQHNISQHVSEPSLNVLSAIPPGFPPLLSYVLVPPTYVQLAPVYVQNTQLIPAQ